MASGRLLTQPYGKPTIHSAADVQTTVLLLVIGVAVTELASWGRRQQSRASQQQGYLEGILQSTGALAMAMPFSAVPTPFRVNTPRGTWWANCAWDALGIPVMLSSPAKIDTTCGDCGTPLRIETTAHDLVPNTGVIHFAVPARDWWADIGFT